LRASALDDAALATLQKRLVRLDAKGPWTRATLQLIADNPAVRAGDLAASVARETAPFKIDVRKLKNLGMTESLEVGYRISPRGQQYLDSFTED
jgi:predicted transcriptional regulator